MFSTSAVLEYCTVAQHRFDHSYNNKPPCYDIKFKIASAVRLSYQPLNVASALEYLGIGYIYAIQYHPARGGIQCLIGGDAEACGARVLGKECGPLLPQQHGRRGLRESRTFQGGRVAKDQVGLLQEIRKRLGGSAVERETTLGCWLFAPFVVAVLLWINLQTTMTHRSVHSMDSFLVQHGRYFNATNIP